MNGTPENILRGRQHGDVFARLRSPYNASRGTPVSYIKYEFSAKDISRNGSMHGLEIYLQETWHGKFTIRGRILGKVRKVSQWISEGTTPREVFEMGGWAALSAS